MTKITKKSTERQFREKIPVKTLKLWKKQIRTRGRGKKIMATTMKEMACALNVTKRTIEYAFDKKVRLATPDNIEAINKFLGL